MNTISYLINSEEDRFLFPNELRYLSDLLFERKINEMSEFYDKHPNKINSSVDIEDDSILNYAIRYCCIDIVKHLVKLGANVNRQSEPNYYNHNTSNSPLKEAVRANNLDICSFLLKNGSDVNLTDNMGQTAFFTAFWGSDDEMVRLLLDAGVDVNISDNTGKTALDYPINVTDHESDSPLHSTAHESLLKTKMLLERGDDVNSKNIFGLTPLHNAAISEQFEIIKWLLKYKADKTILSKKGETPLEYAFNYHGEEFYKKKNPQIVNLLMSYPHCGH